MSQNVHGKSNYLKFLTMKNLKKLGKVLGKQEQKNVFGGLRMQCNCDRDCPQGQWCCARGCVYHNAAGYCPPQECPTDLVPSYYPNM